MRYLEQFIGTGVTQASDMTRREVLKSAEYEWPRMFR